MWIRSALLSVCLTVLIIPTCTSQQMLKAHFNMAGIFGWLTFSQQEGSNEVTLDWNITGSGSYTWQLHQYYLNYDTVDKCDISNVGDRYGTSGGTVNAGTSQSTVSNISLFGLNSIEGRTIKLLKVGDANMKICATILSTQPYTTLYTEFHNNLFGSIYFRQAHNQSQTIIYTNVYFGNSQHSQMEYTMKIFSGSHTSCSDATSVFNPTGSAGNTCSSTNHGNCMIGKVSDKVGNLVVGNTRGTNLGRFTDLNLPLTGSNSINGHTLALLDNAGKIMYCSQIKEMQSRTARSIFNMNGVKGHITFTQKSVFDYTSIEVYLKGLNNTADGYHVHNYPVPQRATKGQAVCGGIYVSGHFNPYNIIKANGPADAVGTNDQYEVGDMSGKFGGLAGKDSIEVTFEDWNMPLFGQNSIVHRSVVIHYASDGARWICSNINDMYPIKTAIARFTYPYIGQAIIRHRESGHASIYLDLNTGDGSTATKKFNWQIHENKAGADWNAEEARCASTGNVIYQTFNGASDPDYQQCSSNDQRRCHLGDMTSKHGQVTVRSPDGTAAEHLFTDLSISLNGNQNVIGKSIVLLSNNQRMACATIYEMRERYAKVESWSKEVSGYMTFSQSLGVLHSATKVSNKLNNLAGIAGPYHVHNFPISPGSTPACSDASVSGHFNPFEIDVNTDPEPKMGTHDQYEVGDLSGKFGYLSGNSDNSTFFDTNLNLFGVHSVVGRSVVIHKASDGSRWSCGNLVEDTSMTGGILYQTMAKFDTHIRGHVILSQYMYSDGSMSDTSVEIDLYYADGSEATYGHNWHVHENPIQGDDQAATGICASAGGHFNPFKVNLEQGYNECGPENPLRCEVGDQSRKMGTYNIGKGRWIGTDVYLPLNGMYSVIGRGIVFHVKDGGADRFACATLMPMAAPEPIALPILRDGPVDRAEIGRILAESIGAPVWQVMVMETTGSNTDCTNLQIYFHGPNAEAFKVAGQAMVAEKTAWGIFTICTSGSSHVTMTLSLVLSVLFIGNWIM